jgi:hypothetical protein
MRTGVHCSQAYYLVTDRDGASHVQSNFVKSLPTIVSSQ